MQFKLILVVLFTSAILCILPYCLSSPTIRPVLFYKQLRPRQFESYSPRFLAKIFARNLASTICQTNSLRERASTRQTNKDALEELANNLFASGNYMLNQNIVRIKITRSNLASKKDQFAWDILDLPPSFNINARKI
jgi:hypothetical protein